ncbi:MAG: YidC/Oxa1 family membrane protein insertase [Chloroflexota bacterium]
MTVREQSSRSLLFILAAVWIVSLFFLFPQFSGETPADEATSEETSSVDLSVAGTQKVEEGGVTLAIQSNYDTPEVTVGSQIAYTVIIENNSNSSIQASYINRFASDLVLEDVSLEASSGEIAVGENQYEWSGELGQNKQIVVNYTAHPNYFSTPNQTLENVVSLQAAGRTLETKSIVINERSIWKYPILGIAQVLDYMADWINRLGLPYAYGFAIVFFTVIIRAATFPLNKKQIESTKATQEIQPILKELQKKYGDDREKLAQEQMRLYREYGVNPLGGCLPLIVQMPIWLSLYRALFHMAGDTEALQEGFFWIPSLAGPVGAITSTFGGGIEWLLPWTEGFLGWSPAIAYLVLPVLLVVTQLYMQRMMTPQTDDPQQKMMAQVMMFMPFMFGYFALVVPSGLSLYWFTSNLLGIVQQYYMMKAKEEMELASKNDQDAKPSLRQLEVSPVAATADGASDGDKQVKDNATKRSKSRSKRKRKRKK